jgi:broad specificity phosphatase PhoE
MIYDLIFVRHGQSCANLLAKGGYGRQYLYKDPELSKQGVYVSKSLSASFIKNIYKRWEGEPFSVCTSQMIRAQETAFYMIASSLALPINVLPHVGEKGITLDNYAFPIEKQLEIMLHRNPAIADLVLKGLDGREKQTLFEKANFKKFLTWASLHPEYFVKGSDGVFRGVIFTHSHYIKEAFGLNFDMKNNEAIHTRFDIQNPPEKFRFEYWPIHDVFSLDRCPDDCLISNC